MATHKGIQVNLTTGQTHELETGEVKLEGGAISIVNGSFVTVFGPGAWISATYQKGSGGSVML